MAEIVVVRHGQAAFGTDDYDRLTAVGWEQSRLLGAYFANTEQHFDVVCTGTMRRHRETLAGVSDVLARSSIVPNATELAGLNEYDFHRLIDAYITLNDHALDDIALDLSDSRMFYRVLRRALMAWSENKLQNVAEPWCDFEERVQGILVELARLNGRVLVVTSGGPASALLRSVLKLDVAAMVNINLQAKNTGVSRYFTRGTNFSLNMFNAVPHLESPGLRQLITYT